MKNTIKIEVVIHNPSGFILYGGRFIPKLPDSQDFNPAMIGSIHDIGYRGVASEGIIDTAYFSPADFGKEEWDDDDDTTDDYSVVEISLETNRYYVKYYNFRPDYSIQGHIGGYKEWFEAFDTLEEAEAFIDDLDDSYRGEIMD